MASNTGKGADHGVGEHAANYRGGSLNKSIRGLNEIISEVELIRACEPGSVEYELIRPRGDGWDGKLKVVADTVTQLRAVISQALVKITRLEIELQISRAEKQGDSNRGMTPNQARQPSSTDGHNPDQPSASTGEEDDKAAIAQVRKDLVRQQFQMLVLDKQIQALQQSNRRLRFQMNTVRNGLALLASELENPEEEIDRTRLDSVGEKHAEQEAQPRHGEREASPGRHPPSNIAGDETEKEQSSNTAT